MSTIKEFDENEAIKAMRASLPEGRSQVYSDDDLLNLVDIIWDYYEVNGLLEIDMDEDETEVSVADIVDYAERMIRKDKGANIAPDDIPGLVEAELDYENSLLN